MKDELSDVKVFGSDYMKDSLTDEVKEEVPEVVYGKNHLQVGRRVSDGSIYTIDISEACRVLALGATRCLPKGTLVKTIDGFKSIESCDKVLSYNFNKNIIEEKQCIVNDSGLKDVFEIHLPKKVIKCSANHKWFVKRNNNIIEVETKDILLTDKLLRIKGEKILEEIDILDIKKTDCRVRMFDLEVEDNHNFILEDNIITHNSGKTFLARSICDRLMQVGRKVIFLTDIKNEFWSSRYPVQDKFRDKLLPGESPTPLKVVPLRPTFFKDIKKPLAKHNYWYSFDPREMSANDFKSLMNVEKMSPKQKISMEIIYEIMSKYLKKHPDETLTFELIAKIIEDGMQNLNSAEKSSLLYRFFPLRNSSFFDPNYKRNVLSLLSKSRDYVPSINVECFDEFGSDSSLSFPSVTLNIILRSIVDARKSDPPKIPPVWVIIDEMTRFIHRKKSNSLKSTILECLEENTLIRTNNGDKKIKDLDENKDMVLSFDGINNVWSNFHLFGKDKKKLYKVELDNGKSFVCSENHRFFSKEMKEYQLKDLNVGDKIAFDKICLFCGKSLNKGEKYCSYRCSGLANNKGEKNPMFGRKNPHTERSKKKIRISVKKMFDENINNVKGKISKSSKRTYDERMGREKSMKIKEIRRKQFKNMRNNDPRFDASKVKANLGRKLSAEWKNNISVSGKRFWGNLSNEEKDELIKKTIWSCRGRGRMTKLEEKSNKILKKYNFVFLGNGINGNLNGLYPDFVNYNKKIIVEVFTDYWKNVTYGSRDSYEKIRRKQFNDWAVYFFEEKEINKIEVVMNEIFKN